MLAREDRSGIGGLVVRFAHCPGAPLPSQAAGAPL
jgi:hypothetical protein